MIINKTWFEEPYLNKLPTKKKLKRFCTCLLENLYHENISPLNYLHNRNSIKAFFLAT